eukprot:CCRYP_005028-RA/>CCRYP_005028-RA protein AED:0.33 eAED:0.33 QI:403/1/1/1/1/1/2/72/434
MGQLVFPGARRSISSTTLDLKRYLAIRYALLLVASLAFVSIQLHDLRHRVLLTITPTPPINALASDLTTVFSPLIANQDVPSSASSRPEDEADSIVRRAYERTYAKILPCSDDRSGEDCIMETRTLYKPPPTNDVDDDDSVEALNPALSIPWWFQTLLRDIPKSGIYGHWHYFNSASPPMQFCSIEKVGTTEWRKIFCMLNNDRNHATCKIQQERDDDDSHQCWTQCVHRRVEEGTLPPNAPKAVIVRDPLERLLSAYLNKCYDEYYRQNEEHCEPTEIFGDKYSETGMLSHVKDSDQQMFAAYLDIMPLKWNLHFIPQAFACDLYRNIKQYDFVGKMDGNFMMDLNRMANQFGGPLPDLLDSFFGYRNYTKSEINHVNVGSRRGHSTRAPNKVVRFYTPNSLRRALEYVSIDYVTLGLEVPEWAREMLRKDAI